MYIGMSAYKPEAMYLQYKKNSAGTEYIQPKMRPCPACLFISLNVKI